MDKIIVSAKCKAAAIKERITSKKLGDSQVVVALILIVVAIGLCIIFQKQVNGIITNVAGKVNAAVNSLSNGTPN